ncbi:MAG: DUF4177 domain-containing protein [Chlorobiales bacterium]|nr:DUF4177 domain-containing protein [Chlorobiales bacterium]
MKQYKVIKIKDGGRQEVKALEIEKVLNDLASEGWELSQISTGGLSYDDFQSYEWVYLVFERE